jgi:DNA-binding response OmpR family regulator
MLIALSAPSDREDRVLLDRGCLDYTLPPQELEEMLQRCVVTLAVMAI